MHSLGLFFGLMACSCSGGSDSETGGGTDDTTDDGPSAVCSDAPSTTFAAACAGPVEGTFDGDITGPLDGELCDDGLVFVRFDSEVIGGTVSSTGQIAEDGTIDGGESGLAIVGTFDLATCTGAGTWIDTNYDLEGTWE